VIPKSLALFRTCSDTCARRRRSKIETRWTLSGVGGEEQGRRGRTAGSNNGTVFRTVSRRYSERYHVDSRDNVAV
jgi:hypothetical protein